MTSRASCLVAAALLVLRVAAAPDRFAGFPADTLSVRPPAVPLLVTDPFFSIWSPADNATGEAAKCAFAVPRR